VNDLRDKTPDGLRRSAFMEAVAVRTMVSGTVDLKAVGRKPSGERFARCDTGRLAPFRFYGSVRCANDDERFATPDGLRRSAFMEAVDCKPSVEGLLDKTPDALRRSASNPFGTVLLTRPREDRTVK
jgi:hypothetical protein